MARSLTAAMVTEVTAGTIRPFLAVQMQFDSGNLNLWSGYGDLTFDSITFTGSGDLGSVQAVMETEKLKAAGVEFVLSGISTDLISAALTEDYQERKAKLWFGAFDTSMNVVADPFIIFSGRMDVMSFDQGPQTATIKMLVENRLIDMERPSVRRYTPEDQKLDFPSDKGFDFVPTLNDGREINWGT